MGLKELLEKRGTLLDEIDKADEKRFAEIQNEINKLNFMITEARKDKATDPADPDGLDKNGQAYRTQVVNGATVTPPVVLAGAKRKTPETDDLEYRKAFMDYVMRNEAIPAELRADAITKTTDNATVIPTVIVDKIVEKMESTGMILPLVTRTMISAGIVVPTSALKPVATWVAEGATSEKQKKTTGSITFSHYKLRCEIAMTAEDKAMSMAAFETAFITNVSEAMIKALEASIISGTGTGSPKGILTETVPAGQSLEVSVATGFAYSDLLKAEAALPLAYENGAVWCMTKKTFMEIQGISDANKQPVARVNYGITGKPERVILGRPVVLCDYIESYTGVAAKTVAFMFSFKDYMLNTIFDMGIQSKSDWDTENYLTKAVMACDGKVIDTNSLVVIKTKA